MGEAVALVRLHQDVGRGVGVLALEHVLALVDRLHGLLAGLRVDERREPVHHLAAHPLEVGRVHDAVHVAAGQVDADALTGGADRRVRLRLRPVHGLREADLAVQAEQVVHLARDVAHRSPLHRAEDRVRGRELQVAELVQQVVHVQRARAALEPVVADEQDQVVGLGARQERADRVVELLVDAARLGADRGGGVLREVGMVGGDVVRQAVLRAVDAHPDRGEQVPLGVVHQPLAGLDALAGDRERLVQVGVGPVAVRGPAHAVDRPLQAGLLQRVLEVGGVADAAALRQDAAGDQVPGDVGRRERERDVQQELLLAGRGEVGQERALLDRLVGDRVRLVGAGDGLEDVVDAVVGRVDAGQEARPRGPRVRGDRGLQDALLPPVDQRLQVRQVAALEERVEDAPIGAIPRDQDHSGHAKGTSLAMTIEPRECTEVGWRTLRARQSAVGVHVR